MLSRSETVIRLIEIRKILSCRESDLGAIPDDYHGELKKELDNLLIDVIGVPKEGQHQVNNILNKAVKGDIKTNTAVVAIHEIYNEYKNRDKTETKKETGSSLQTPAASATGLEELYKSGYR